MKTLIVYQSRYGGAQQYAEWLAEDLGSDLLPLSSCPPEKISKYGQIIFGGGIYAGRLAGAAFLSNNKKILQNKRLLVFAVGLHPPQEEALAKILKKSGISWAQAFSLHGGCAYPRMNWLDRFVMRIVYFLLKKNPQDSEEYRYKMEHFFEGFTLARREALDSLREAAGKK